MAYKFNPFTGTLDDVGAGGGGGTPGGSTTQVQFNDGGAFAGDADLVWNKTTNVLGITGDVNLSDGGTYTTTLQTITPTAARTISLPDATGTVALVAGSSGQLIYNNAGVNAGASTLTYDGSILTTSGRFINSYNATASAPAKAFTGTWFTGGTATTTKPQVLIEPTGATSTAWSTSGTGLGVNAASGFAGNLLDLQVNGTRSFAINASGNITSFLGGTINIPGTSEVDGNQRINISASSGSISYLRTTVPGGESRFGLNGGLAIAGSFASSPFHLYTSGIARILIDSGGNTQFNGAVTVATGSALAANHRLTGTAPATASSTGTAGDVRYDTDYVYICTATNTWKRAALTTW
jgi:hypothetical protein